MRIGIFTESYPPLINGVSTSVQTLIAQLEHAGHAVFVFTSRYPRYKDDAVPMCIAYPSVNAIVEPDYVLPIPISPTHRRHYPHARSWTLSIPSRRSCWACSPAASRGAWSAARFHQPHALHGICALCSAGAAGRSRAARRPLDARLLQLLRPCPRAVRTDARAPDEGYGVHAPVTVVPTGIPAPPYLLVEARRHQAGAGTAPDARLLLYVGRLAPEKNLEMLLRAFQKIAAKTEDTYLVIAGSGKSAGALRRLRKQLGHRGRASSLRAF